MTLTEFAAHVGRTQQAVSYAVDTRRLRRSVGRDARGRPFIADLELALAEWEQNSSRPAGVRRGSSSGEGRAAGGRNGADREPEDSLVAAQRQVALERARKLQLENRVREGELVAVSVARSEAFEFARAIQTNVLNLPARLSGQLAAENDQGKVYSILDAALREACSAVADVLEASMGEAPEVSASGGKGDG